VTQFLNPAAFNQPCVLSTDPNNPNGPPIPIPDQPRGCVPLTGLGALGGSPTQVARPGFGRVDLSIFKDIQFTDRFRLQFRAEFFNILNHPNFNAPGFDNNNLDFKTPNFGQISSTRDAPNDPRQIQFALKLYY